MALKEALICDICQNELAIEKCDICGKDICRHHKKDWSVKLGSGYLAKIKLCTECVSHIEYSKGMESSEELRRILLEFIKKQMIMDELKDV